MITVKWIDRGYEPKNPPDPKYPDGFDIDLTKGNALRRSCQTALPYPAKRCGYYAIRCTSCGLSTMVTTAGRADDPRSVRLPCKPS